MADKIRFIHYSPDEFLVGVQGMTTRLIGLYWVVCSLIYSRGGPIENDAKRIAGFAGCRKAAARQMVDELIRRGKLRRTDDGLLTNGRADSEIARAKRAVSSSKANAKRAGIVHKANAKQRAELRAANGLAEPGGSESRITSHESLSLPHTEGGSPRAPSARPGGTPRGVPTLPQNGAGRASLIPDDWQPSDDLLGRLRKMRPDLVGSHYDLELVSFRSWAKSRAVLTHHVESSFIGFMIKAKPAPAKTREERDAETSEVIRREIAKATGESS